MLTHKPLSERKPSPGRLIWLRPSRLVSAISLALLVALIPAVPSQAGGASSTAHSPATENLPHTSSQSSFEQPRTLPTGFEAEALAVGDFNNDQVPDIVATTSQSSVTVLLGQGGGDFVPPVEFDLGRRPSYLALADFNSDGNLDIAAASYMHDGVMVLSGDGEGDFSGLLAIDVGPGTGGIDPPSPVALVAEDFNHDGTVDIATLNSNSGDVSLLTGNGQGQFSGPANYPSDGAVGSLLPGDFDADGWTDLATSDSRSIILLLDEEGSGFGNPLKIINVLISPVITVADFDGDGFEDDVAAVTQDSQTEPYVLRVFLGDRGGGYFQNSESPLTEQSAAPTSLAVGDTNGDGAPDIVAVYGMVNRVTVIENRGGGQFAEQVSYAIADNGTGVTLADLDDDRALDILVATEEGIQVLMGTRPAGASGSSSTATPPASGTSPSLWLDPAEAASDPQTLQDLSGNSNDGILSNFDNPAAAYGGDGALPVARYITFDGVDDVVVAQNQVDAPDDFTIAVWFRTTTAAGKIAGFENQADTTSATADRHMYIATNGSLRFGGWHTTPDLGSHVLVSRDPVNDGQWHLAVGTMELDGAVTRMALYIDGVRQVEADSPRLVQYAGFWRLGGGTLAQWQDWSSEFFKGDIGSFRVYDFAMSEDEVAALTAAPETEPTSAPPGEPATPSPELKVSSEIDGETLHLDISLFNIPDLAQTYVYVVREDDVEFLAGSAGDRLEWTGDAVTGNYTVEARHGELGNGESIVASSTVPVLAPIASEGEIATAVGIGVAVAAASSAAAATGFSLYDFVVRVLKIILTEKMRSKTRKLDFNHLPSWVAALAAILLMAVLLAVGKPGALELHGFGKALIVTSAAAVLLRTATLIGGVFLAFVTHQKPRYLIWAAGTVTFAVTSIALHSPFGYTGYMSRSPGNPARDARFAVAGFSVLLTLGGVFLLIGTMTQMVFAETGITLVLGGLATGMLPFPLMGGYAIWRWSKPVAVVGGVAGLVPYSLFQYGLLSPETIYIMAMAGFTVFATVMIADLWIAEDEKQKAQPVPAPEGAAGPEKL